MLDESCSGGATFSPTFIQRFWATLGRCCVVLDEGCSSGTNICSNIHSTFLGHVGTMLWCWTTVFQTVPRSFDISAWIFSQKCERQTLICAYAFLKRLKCGATFLEQRKRWDDVRWKFEGNQTPFKMFQHCWEACKHSFNTCWAGVGRVFAHLNVGTVWTVIQPFSPTSLSGCKISLHYPHKTSCFVMRKNNLIIYSNLSKMKSKILPTCLQGYFRDSLEDIWHFGGLFHRENVLGFFVEKLN